MSKTDVETYGDITEIAADQGLEPTIGDVPKCLEQQLAAVVCSVDDPDTLVLSNNKTCVRKMAGVVLTGSLCSDWGRCVPPDGRIFPQD